MDKISICAKSQINAQSTRFNRPTLSRNQVTEMKYLLATFEG